MNGTTTVIVRRQCREQRMPTTNTIEHWSDGACVTREPLAPGAQVAPGTLVAILGCGQPDCSCRLPGVAGCFGRVGQPESLTLPVPSAEARGPLFFDWPDGTRRVAFEVAGGIHDGLSFAFDFAFDGSVRVVAHEPGDTVDGAARLPAAVLTRILLGAIDIGELVAQGEISAPLTTLTVLALGLEMVARPWENDDWAVELLAELEGCGFCAAA